MYDFTPPDYNYFIKIKTLRALLNDNNMAFLNNLQSRNPCGNVTTNDECEYGHTD